MISQRRLYRIILAALFSAIALIAVYFFHIPIFEFLEYDPKDIILTIGSLTLGPWCTLGMIIVVSFIHTFTIGTGGFIGFLMEVLASAAFCLPVAALYRRKPEASSLLLGLVLGSLGMAITMLFWNVLFTPLFLGIPREAIFSLLIKVILPFNLGKAIFNSLLILLLSPGMIKVMRRI